MNNKRIIVVTMLAAALLLGGVVLASMLLRGPADGSGGPAALPPVEAQDNPAAIDDSAAVEPEDARDAAPGPVDPSVIATDPVPDDLVQAFFGMIEDAGSTPTMNETYTVEFVETTDRVRIDGRFEEGSKEFEFQFEDDTWKLETGL